MALSLALNWSPPPSSPLFDEGTSAADLMTASDRPSGSSQSSSSLKEVTNNSNPRTSSFNSSDVHKSPDSTSSKTQAESNADAPRSYAAAASKQQQQPLAYPVPSYAGQTSATGGPQYYSSLSSQRPTGRGALPAWSSYQDFTSQVSEDGRRQRTTSGPQKQSTHLLYNDTLQHYPAGAGQNVANASQRSAHSNLPAGAMGATQQSSATSPAANANGGYHPYRRAPKSSDPPSSPVQYSLTGAPVLAALPGQPSPAATALSPQSVRARVSSAASSVTAKEAGRREAEASVASRGGGAAAAQPITYSSAVSGRGQAGGQRGLERTVSPPRDVASQQTPALPHKSSDQYSHQQEGQRPVNMPRSESGRSLQSNSANSIKGSSTNNVHARTDSSSSGQSTTDNSQHSHASTSPASSSGRSTPTTMTAINGKKPSPLSKAPQRTADDDDSEAVYGGSDDENTIRGRSTPTPGDKYKKNFSNKLKKALSFSTLTEIQQAEAAAAVPDRAYGGRSNIPYTQKGKVESSGETNESSGSTRSTSPPRTPDNGAPPMLHSSAASIASKKSSRPPLSGEGTAKRSIFNRKFNSSTDNISISSTVSSASVMLRKVGNLGKIARRHSLMGLTNMFNKDKEEGREGLHDDDFGTVPPTNLVAADDAALGAKSKKEAKKTKKGIPALASVSHATVELETSSGVNGSESSMTPAASYVRQHQIQMQQQAEADRIARVKAEQAEAERLAAIQKNTKTTDDVTESRQKMIEKEKERLKSKRGWRKKLGVGSSSSDAKQSTGLETMPADESQSASQINAPAARGYSSSSYAGAGGLPNKDMPSATAPALPYRSNDGSVDSAFDDEGLEPPHMPGAMEGYESSGDDYETDSLRHWGEGIERSRESAAKIKSVRGILKSNPSFAERSSPMHSPPISASASFDKPFANRIRANSYDAPQGQSHGAHSQVPLMSQISSSTPAATDRVDGVPRTSQSDEARGHASSQSSNTDGQSAGSPTSSSSFGHHANSSMPTLSMMMNPSPTGKRSVTAPTHRKQLVFADAHIYHSTWPAHIYDRRGEAATCNRLTPLLAQRIKEELNTYKMEEMAVAPSSRIHTHFFV